MKYRKLLGVIHLSILWFLLAMPQLRAQKKYEKTERVRKNGTDIVAVANDDKGVIRIENKKSGRVLQRLEHDRFKKGTISDMAFSPTDSFLAVTIWNDDLLLFNWRSEEVKHHVTWDYTGSSNSRVAFSPGGRKLLVGVVDVKIVDVDSGEVERHFTVKEKGCGPIGPIRVSPFGDIAAMYRTPFSPIKIWNLRLGKGRPQQIVSNDVVITRPFFSFSPDGTMLAYLNKEAVVVRDLVEDEQVIRISRDGTGDGWSGRLSVTNDGMSIVYSPGKKGEQRSWTLSRHLKKQDGEDLRETTASERWKRLSRASGRSLIRLKKAFQLHPEQTVSFLRNKLLPEREGNEQEKMLDLIDQLEQKSLKKRKEAERRIKEIVFRHPGFVSLLERKKKKVGPEAKHRIRTILETLNQPLPKIHSHRWRRVVALQVLYGIHTRPAKKLVKKVWERYDGWFLGQRADRLLENW